MGGLCIFGIDEGVGVLVKCFAEEKPFVERYKTDWVRTLGSTRSRNEIGTYLGAQVARPCFLTGWLSRF